MDFEMPAPANSPWSFSRRTIRCLLQVEYRREVETESANQRGCVFAGLRVLCAPASSVRGKLQADAGAINPIQPRLLDIPRPCNQRPSERVRRPAPLTHVCTKRQAVPRQSGRQRNAAEAGISPLVKAGAGLLSAVGARLQLGRSY